MSVYHSTKGKNKHKTDSLQPIVTAWELIKYIFHFIDLFWTLIPERENILRYLSGHIFHRKQIPESVIKTRKTYFLLFQLFCGLSVNMRPSPKQVLADVLSLQIM